MVSRNDCMLLLDELEQQGIDTKAQSELLFKTHTLPMEVLQFINNHRQLDLTAFYTKIRKAYNNKRSKLYKNIVAENITDNNEILTTLSALQTQIFIFAKEATNEEAFIKQSRVEDISKVVYNYTQTYNLVPCIKLLQIIKADLKICECLHKSTEEHTE